MKNKTPEKVFKKRLTRLYIEENYQAGKQRKLEVMLAICIALPILLICFLPCVFIFVSQTAGIYTLLGLVLFQALAMAASLFRKNQILRRHLKVRIGEEKLEIIPIENVDGFEEFCQSLLVTVTTKSNISEELLNLIYNWLNNLNVLKDEPLKLYIIKAKQLEERYHYDVMQDKNAVCIAKEDLNSSEENLQQFFKEYKFMFYEFFLNTDDGKEECQL